MNSRQWQWKIIKKYIYIYIPLPDGCILISIKAQDPPGAHKKTRSRTLNTTRMNTVNHETNSTIHIRNLKLRAFIKSAKGPNYCCNLTKISVFWRWRWWSHWNVEWWNNVWMCECAYSGTFCVVCSVVTGRMKGGNSDEQCVLS